MHFDTQGHEFDLRVQRFLKGRWETDIGERVRNEIIEGLKGGVEVRGILDPYVLQHPDNLDPYGHPVYPIECIAKGKFWVLHPDDIRGIHFYNEDFSSSPSFEVKMLDYARFFNCDFSNVNMERCSLTRVNAEKCDFSSAIFASSGGFYTRFHDCNLFQSCLWMAQFIEPEFIGSSLRGAYFEDAVIIRPAVDYRTDFGNCIARSWKTRSLPLSQLPDIYRVIRTAFESAELYHRADAFLYKERNAFRTRILNSHLRATPTVRLAVQWLTDVLWDWSMGYGTKPFRILLIGPILVAVFTLLYCGLGVPFAGHVLPSTWLEYAYFSMTALATLGFGDLTFGVEHPLLRLVSAGEAMFGATWVAVLVAVLSRKLVR